MKPTNARHTLILITLILILSVSGCSNKEITTAKLPPATASPNHTDTPETVSPEIMTDSNAEEEPSSTPVPEATPEVSYPAHDIPSELAASLGITLDNYPKINGSTATFPLVQFIYTNMFIMNPENKSNTSSGLAGLPEFSQVMKTIPSYEALINGDLDMIIAPSPSEEIEQKAAEAGVELEYIPIGVEALVFITHTDNPATGLTLGQAREIYTDMSITNWKELGGPDSRLIPICRNPDSGSQAQMDQLVLDGEPIHPAIKETYMERDMNGMIQMVEDYLFFAEEGEEEAYTLGYTLYYYLDLAESFAGELYAKPLALDGVEPTPETLLSEKYPLSIKYYAVIRSDTPKDHPTRTIIGWLLTEDGQWTVSYAGLGALRSLYHP